MLPIVPPNIELRALLCFAVAAVSSMGWLAAECFSSEIQDALHQGKERNTLRCRYIVATHRLHRGEMISKDSIRVVDREEIWWHTPGYQDVPPRQTFDTTDVTSLIGKRFVGEVEAGEKISAADVDED